MCAHELIVENAVDVSTIATSNDVNEYGYRSFTIGDVKLSRDSYFVQVEWPEGSHLMGIDSFLATTARCVQFSFFVGSFLYDGFFGWTNHYGTVEFFIGRDDPAYVKAGLVKQYILETEMAKEGLAALLDDWVAPGAIPFKAPLDCESSIGRKRDNATGKAVLGASRVMAERMLSVTGDAQPNSAPNFPKVEGCSDVVFSPPEIYPEPGFEEELFAYDVKEHLSRQSSTWCPGVCSMVQGSAICMTSEEFDLNLWHRNDRFEWFIQLANEIHWDIEDGDTGEKRARVIMKAGDVSAMPHDIRHRGYTPNRAWVTVWENFSPTVHEKVINGDVPSLSKLLKF